MNKVVLFALLFVQCSCSKSKNDLRIPNVADLDTSNGSVGNIGGAIASIGNIANIGQSNIGQLPGFPNLAASGLPNIPSFPSPANIANQASLGNLANIAQSNIGPSNIGNVAGIIQSNIDAANSQNAADTSANNNNNNNNNNSNGGSNNGQSGSDGSQVGLGNVVGIIQSNINSDGDNSSDNNNNNNGQSGSDGSQASVGNIANIAQSNIQGQQGSIGNIAGILQSNIGQQANGIGNIANIGQSNVGSLPGIGNIAGIGQSNINGIQNGNIPNFGQNNLANILNYLANSGQNYYPYGNGYNNNGNYYYGNNNNFNNRNRGQNNRNIGFNDLRNNNRNNNNNFFFVNSNFDDRLYEERNIERPCQIFDTYCIRKYFAEHSKCKESHGPVPDPMYRAQSTKFIPRINLTITTHDVLYSGLNGRIEEFYIDKETDKLVLAIEFRNLTFYSKDGYFRFHRRAREPLVRVDYFYVNYESVVATIIIPNRKDLQLQKSETTAFLNAIPTFSIGPKVFEDPDPTIQLTRIQLLADLSGDAQETLLTESPYYMSTFIQHSLCDFGLKVL